jgi:hypothetical protein
MKKIVYILLFAVAIAFLSGRGQSSQNALAGNKIKPSELKETNADAKLPSSETVPKIYFLLNNENGQSNWSPALWWSYNHNSKTGC